MATADTVPDHEFGFELRVCRWAEHRWPPTAPGVPVIVARQLGTERRRWDTVIVEVDPDAMSDRAQFGPETLDSDLLHVLRNAPADWAWYRDSLPDPGYPWRYVREAVHRAADRDVLETRRRNNRIEIRRTAPYPNWVERIVAIENKPDLEASAAADLADQLERDTALGLADEVWVATRRTGRRTEPVLLEAIPDAAGVITFDFGSGNPARVLWHPRRLATDAPGTRVVDRSRWAVRFEYMSREEKGDKRLELAERAFGRGWRSYVDRMRPDCAAFALRRAPLDGRAGTTERVAYVPYCREKGREQTGAECSGSCPQFSPEPPAWRQREWPLEGGPGATARRLLDTRRRRQRPTDVTDR